MKKLYLLLLILIVSIGGYSQNELQKSKKVFNYPPNGTPIHPTVVKYPDTFFITKPLRDAPIIKPDTFTTFIEVEREDRERYLDPDWVPDIQPAPDVQKYIPSSKNSVTILQLFEGQQSPYFPPDANGDVGPDHYFQTVNLTYQIFDKNGNSVAGPSNLNTIFDPNLDGANYNDGDPIVLWDDQAGRWFYAEFSVSGTNDYMLIAVSKTKDPTGEWYSWSFDVDDMPDYMKFGIWQDGYYMATNTSNGNDVYVFERSKMLAGDPNPVMVGFDNPWRPATFDGFHCIMPLDNDSTFAPSGTPGMFITIADDGQGNPADELWLYELDIDWNDPSNATFTRTQTLAVNAFDGDFSGNWDNIPQPNTTQKLDGLSTILMFRAQYRNFGAYQTIVAVHTIDVNGDGSVAGLRWYELRNDNDGSGWYIKQQSTFSPDNTSRWAPSIAINAHHQIAIGYSVSDGTSTYPGIRVVGQSSCAADNTLDIPETVIYDGQYYQSSYNRWGDYAAMSVDPSDGTTFWFTTEYVLSDNKTKSTKIVAFQLNESCAPPSITSVSDDHVYKDRGKRLTIEGENFLGATVTLGGITGTIISNSGTEIVVQFPPADYPNGKLVVSNSVGSASKDLFIYKRNTIPVVAGSLPESDNHPDVNSALEGLSAWYGTNSFDAGDLPGTKTIEVYSGSYTGEVDIPSTLEPTANSMLVIKNHTGDQVSIVSNSDYGFKIPINYVKISGFIISGATNAGIYATGDYLNLIYNQIYNNDTAGIILSGSDNSTLENNLVYNNKYGIYIKQGDNNKLKNNTLVNNGEGTAGGTGTLLSEDFENYNGGWSVYKKEGNDSWYLVNGDGVNNSVCVEIRDPDYFYGWLVSPALSIPSGVTSIQIEFDHRTDYRSAYNTVWKLQWSTSPSANDNDWTDIDTWIGSSNHPTSYTHITENLSVTPNTTIYLGWYGENNNQDGWRVDNVLVTYNLPPRYAGGGIFIENGNNTILTNNILYAKDGNDAYYSLKLGNVSVSSDYNLFYKNGNQYLIEDNGTKIADLASWASAGANDLEADPLFVDPTNGDFHIQSQFGSYHNTAKAAIWPPETATGGSWVADANNSPALDAGNPADDYSNEPQSGGRINIGVFGNTAQASKSSAEIVWNGSVSDDWQTAANWTPNVVPTASDDARIPSGCPNYPLIDETGDVCLNLKVDDGGAFTVSTGGDLSIGGNLTVGDGTSGSVVINDGSLNVSGSVSFAANSYLGIAGGSISVGSITFDPASITEYNANANQDIYNWNYGNLVLSGSGDKNILGDPTTPTTCQDLTINSGTVLVIAEGKALTANGTVTNNVGTSGILIKSSYDASAGETYSGSLILNTANIGATVVSHLEGTQWHYVSSPIDGAPRSLFNPNNFLYWDASALWLGVDDNDYTPWNDYTATNLVNAQGYAYYYYTTDINYEGNLNVGSYSITLRKYTGTEGEDQDQGWNLIGNPYSSPINWDLVAQQTIIQDGTVESAIYLFDDDAQTGDQSNYRYYIPASPNTGGYGIGTQDASKYVPIGQGFFVRTTTDNVVLNLDPSNREHGLVAFYKNKSAENYQQENVLRFFITGNEGKEDEFVVRSVPVATVNFDASTDARKMFPYNNAIPMLYCLDENLQNGMAINSIPIFFNHIQLPLVVKATSGSFTIDLRQNTYDGDLGIYLEDKLNNSINDLKLSPYTFTFSGGADTNRFVLHLVRNTPPFIKGQVNYLRAVEDQYFEFDLNTIFDDTTAYDVLSFSMLPNSNLAWLNISDNKIYGTPSNSDVGEYNLTLIATDKFGEQVSYDVLLYVQNVNDAPILNGNIPDQTILAGQIWQYTHSEDLFIDIDPNDNITYSADFNGEAFPAWLYYGANDHTFVAFPTSENIGTYIINIYATDLSGEMSSTSFKLNVLDPTEVDNVNGLAIYPNPTDGIVNVVLPKNTIANMKIFDISGKMLKLYLLKSSRNHIDISYLPSGVYKVEIIFNNNVYSFNLIKN